MHTHGVHGYSSQLSYQPITPKQSTDGKTADAALFSQLGLTDEGEQRGATGLVDPEENAEPGATAVRNPNPSSSYPPVAGALIPDMTVEPLVYGASGKIKYVLSRTGQKVNGSA